jgi:hypothetical protein
MQHVHMASNLENDPHGDLPPHFAMESDDYYGEDPELQQPNQVPDRSVQKTPDSIQLHQQDLQNEISPPRQWERAASLDEVASPHKQRTHSPYEVRAPVAPPSLPLAAPADRNRSASSAATRATLAPKRELTVGSTASYPSRKAPSHLKFSTTPVAPTAPRTMEEDFHIRRGGYPIVAFGFGGQMITMIPRVPHRVQIHGAPPSMVPGPVTFTNIRGVIEPPGLAASFPGPLFTGTKPVKAKGKDIGKWLDDYLASLEHMSETVGMTDDDLHRLNDRKVLCRLVKVLVDHNGVLDGTYCPSCSWLTLVPKLRKV